MPDHAGVNEMTVQGRPMLLVVVRSGTVVHLAAAIADGRPAVPEQWLERGRRGYDESIEVYDRSALVAARWAPLTLCAVGWLCMADTDAGALHGEHDPRHSPTCRRCLGRIDREFVPTPPDDRIAVLAELVANVVEEHGSAQVLGVPGPQVMPLRQAIQRELRRRLGTGGRTWHVDDNVLATHDRATASEAVLVAVRDAMQRIGENSPSTVEREWLLRWDTWAQP